MATADEPARKPPAPPALYGGPAIDRVTIQHLHAAKAAGERWPMLTAYDVLTAQIFDQAGIPVLLVGDSAANNVLGYVDTLGITVDELLPLCRAVSRGAQRAMVVADLPFGSYQSSPQLALDTATRFVKESGAHAIKLEGGARVAEHVALISGAGVPVMAHIGFTPQSVHATSGYRVQGRGDAGDQLVRDAVALQDAGAFAVVLEMVPAATAARVTAELTIPTIGIGAGAECDAQVMVWQDMAGLREGPLPKFVKQYANLRGTLSEAVNAFANDVRERSYPDDEHSYH